MAGFLAFTAWAVFGGSHFNFDKRGSRLEHGGRKRGEDEAEVISAQVYAGGSLLRTKYQDETDNPISKMYVFPVHRHIQLKYDKDKGFQRAWHTMATLLVLLSDIGTALISR
jgi:hypothetical protein